MSASEALPIEELGQYFVNLLSSICPGFWHVARTYRPSEYAFNCYMQNGVRIYLRLSDDFTYVFSACYFIDDSTSPTGHLFGYNDKERFRFDLSNHDEVKLVLIKTIAKLGLI